MPSHVRMVLMYHQEGLHLCDLRAKSTVIWAPLHPHFAHERPGVTVETVVFKTVEKVELAGFESVVGVMKKRSLY